MMKDTGVSLLLVGHQERVAGLLQATPSARAYRLHESASIGDALAGARERVFDAALVDADCLPDAGLEAIRRLKAAAPDAEIILIAAPADLASALQAYEREAFAFVQKPCERSQLVSTIERAVERRRMTIDNRRLLWELQTINEIAEGISRWLELEDVLTGALQRIVRAFDAAGGSIRLRDDVTGLYETRAVVGPSGVHQVWNTVGASRGRPSDEVIATRRAVVVEDLVRVLPTEVCADLPIRSAVSVPMLAGADLLGTLSIGAAVASRFDLADERLLASIAGQIVVAVQNARLHDSVRRGKREWERTFDAISDPIAVFDATGRVLRGNTAMAALVGRPITELRRATCHEVGFCGGGCPRCAVGRALGQDEVIRAEVTRADEQIFSVTTFPVAAGPDGASVVQVAKNVTEEIRSARRLQQMSDELGMANGQLVTALRQLKSTQAQLLQAEKLSAIGQLVAGVAHELNNPLTSVIGYAQLLEDELTRVSNPADQRPQSEVAQDLRRIAEESGRAARIVRNLLAFARRQTAARVPQDLTDLVSRVLSLRSYDLRLNDVELVTELEPALPQVVADGAQLQQALLNLILNAEQAMRGRTVRRLTVGVRYDEEASAVELYVADSGHGIDEANLSKIFDPFFTTREVGEGTGLGLSICYGIVRDHGGQISVTSRVHHGTTFSLLLPARVRDLGAAGDEILVGHSDQGERDFISAALVAWGYPVVPTSRADEALDRYRRGDLFAALLDRVLLAPDLQGWRTARTDRARPVPLVLLSMTSDDGEIDRFGREHASAVLAPPFQLRTLRWAVRSLEQEKECV
jgi:two-component system NtrC family sensor kinase